jgi:hypothetical protein
MAAKRGIKRCPYQQQDEQHEDEIVVKELQVRIVKGED